MPEALKYARQNSEKSSVSQLAKRDIDAQIKKQTEPKRPPKWFRDHAGANPLPCKLDEAWDLRYSPDDRSPELNHWWLVAFLDNKLKVPSGFLRGKRFRLQPWQRRFIDEAFAPGCVEATLSCARKNGKSGLLAGVICAMLSRYFCIPNWRGIGVSLGGPQAEQLFGDTMQMMMASGMLDILDENTGYPVLKALRTRPGRFVHERTNTEFRLMGTNTKATGVGASGDLILIDEIGAFADSAGPMIRNLETSTSARGGRTVCISVESAINGFMIERRERAESDASAIYHRYAAPEGCQLDDPKAWLAANPGLGTIKSEAYMRREAAKALATPHIQSSFRNLELNQEAPDASDLLCDPADWKAIETDALPERKGPALVGIDMGGAKAFSGAVAIWPETGRMEGFLACGGIPSPLERGRADGVGDRYVRFQEEGMLIVMDGREDVDPERFIEAVEDRFGVPEIAVGDEYKRNEIAVALRAAGAGWTLRLRRMGAGPSGGEDIRAFTRMIVRRELAVARTLAWPSGIAETMVKISESTRWPAIRQRRKTARIDLVAAALLAAGCAHRWREERRIAAKDREEGRRATAVMDW